MGREAKSIPFEDQLVEGTTRGFGNLYLPAQPSSLSRTSVRRIPCKEGNKISGKVSLQKRKSQGKKVKGLEVPQPVV